MLNQRRENTTKFVVIWPDGFYAICVKIRGEWLLRMPDGTHIGAPRLLSIWRLVLAQGARIERIPD